MPHITPLRRLTAAGLLLTSVLALGQAQAQSQEFQRGYEQGYRDGVTAAQGGTTAPASPMPPTYPSTYPSTYPPGYPVTTPVPNYGGVTLHEARYGTEDSACDAREGVARALGGSGRAAVRVDNGLCGDPAPNRRKFLVVGYSCGNGRALQRQSAWEGETLFLRCR